MLLAGKIGNFFIQSQVLFLVLKKQSLALGKGLLLFARKIEVPFNVLLLNRQQLIYCILQAVGTVFQYGLLLSFISYIVPDNVET